MRLFTAIDLPAAMQQRLAHICFGLPRVRWADPLQMHLTLVFIGEVNPALKAEIIDNLAELAFSPFELHCQGIGSFRSGALWLKVKPAPPLLALEKSIRRQLQGIGGVDPSGRKYHPHITLGRMDRRQPPKLDDFLALNSGDRYSFAVEAFQLKSSQLTAKGALHRVEQRFAATPAGRR